jgi:hypothetical protein
MRFQIWNYNLILFQTGDLNNIEPSIMTVVDQKNEPLVRVVYNMWEVMWIIHVESHKLLQVCKQVVTNHDITRMIQGWPHKVVTILLYQDCSRLVGTTLQHTFLPFFSQNIQAVLVKLGETSIEIQDKETNKVSCRI